MKHVFVVDDEREIRQLIKKYLEKEGYRVSALDTGEAALEEIHRLKPDLIILDITMPGLNGIEVCKAIRKSSEIPIIFVSARSEEIDRIIGLEVGGDDYLTKPFSPRELVARIKNIFRRIEGVPQAREQSKVALNGLMLDITHRVALYKEQPVKLTTKEFETLYYLMMNQGHALSREQILEHVWGYEVEAEGRIVDDVIKRLRKKLTEIGYATTIETVWGFGYKIEK